MKLIRALCYGAHRQHSKAQHRSIKWKCNVIFQWDCYKRTSAIFTDNLKWCKVVRLRFLDSIYKKELTIKNEIITPFMHQPTRAKHVCLKVEPIPILDNKAHEAADAGILSKKTIGNTQQAI